MTCFVYYGSGNRLGLHSVPSDLRFGSSEPQDPKDLETQAPTQYVHCGEGDDEEPAQRGRRIRREDPASEVEEEIESKRPTNQFGIPTWHLGDEVNLIAGQVQPGEDGRRRAKTGIYVNPRSQMIED